MTRRAGRITSTSSLAALLDRRVKELRKHVSKALGSGDVKAIHQARVTTRRLKAALDLLEPILAEQPRRSFARTLRRLRRMLGPSRDVDVMIAHLPELRRSSARGDAADWLGRRLRERRDELARERAKSAVSQVLGALDGWAPLARRIDRAQDQARTLIVNLAPRLLSEFAERATRVARLDLKKSCAAAEDVHALRISGKILRYLLELCEPAGIQLANSVLPRFKRLQEALGLWHDYAALGEQALRFALDEELGMHRPALYGEVLELARACWRKSNAYLRTFAKTWQRDGEDLVQSITSASALPALCRGETAGREPQSVPRAETVSTSP